MRLQVKLEGERLADDIESGSLDHIIELLDSSLQRIPSSFKLTRTVAGKVFINIEGDARYQFKAKVPDPDKIYIEQQFQQKSAAVFNLIDGARIYAQMLLHCLKSARGNINTEAAFNIGYMAGYRKAQKDMANPFNGIERQL